MNNENEKRWREEIPEIWEFYRKGEGHTFGHMEALEIGYLAACKKRQEEIDRLEYEYKAEINRQNLMMTQIQKLKEKIDSLNSAIVEGVEYQNILNEKLQSRDVEIAELKRKSEICYCAYCMDSVERTWEDLQLHMKACEKHPLSIASKEIEKRNRLLSQAKFYAEENMHRSSMTLVYSEQWLADYEQLKKIKALGWEE